MYVLFNKQQRISNPLLLKLAVFYRQWLRDLLPDE